MASSKRLSEREDRAWRAFRFMQLRLEGQLARELLAESGLSYPDYLVLMALTEEADGEMRMFELGRTLGWEKSRLSHQVSRMETRGLVEKAKSEADRRGALVHVTGKGRREIEAAAPGHIARVRACFVDPLSPEQLDALAEAAETVLAALEARTPPTP